MTELRPGVFTRLFAEIAADGRAKARTGLIGLALAVEKQAKINASNGSHRYGTPTPASPGLGPAVISGTLRRAITHTPPVFTVGGWESKVGTGVGFNPPYGRKKTPANKYGYYLETGLRNGSAYPFLKPAFEFGKTVVAPQLFRAAFNRGWPRI